MQCRSRARHCLTPVPYHCKVALRALQIHRFRAMNFVPCERSERIRDRGRGLGKTKVKEATTKRDGEECNSFLGVTVILIGTTCGGPTESKKGIGSVNKARCVLVWRVARAVSGDTANVWPPISGAEVRLLYSPCAIGVRGNSSTGECPAPNWKAWVRFLLPLSAFSLI